MRANRTILKIGGAICACLVGWFIFVEVSGDGTRTDPSEQAVIDKSQASRPRPERQLSEARTKHAIRTAFDMDRRRGTTEEELDSLVEGAIEAGISDDEEDAPSIEEYWEIRKRRIAWYIETLGLGFDLTDRQVEQMKDRLDEMEREFGIVLEKHLAKPKETGMASRMEPPPIPEDMNKAMTWLTSPSYSPTRLCGLSEKQLEITWPDPGAEAPENEKPVPFGPVFTHDLGTDEKYSYVEERFSNNRVPLVSSGVIFPLSMSQVDRMLSSDEGDLLKQAEALTHAQLRTLFLYDTQALKRIRDLMGR